MTSPRAQIGVVGMAVMGSNLARNFARHGFRTAIYNRTTAKTEAVLAAHGDEGEFIASDTIDGFVQSLQRPRAVICMVQAGRGTDAIIEQLTGLLEPGDIIVDGGNSHFTDTIRREREIAAQGFHFVGTGISGGEYGALMGPSIMPGGSHESYETLGPMLEAVSAHVDGEPCCTWIGPDGAGHFVKMIHNGIEYSDMQAIGEAVELLRAAGMTTDEVADVFREWGRGELSSYLIDITADVLSQRDPDTGHPLVDVIRDRARMKGTGTWTVQTALELGVPVNGIAEAVFARALSGHDDLRVAAQRTLVGPDRRMTASNHQRFVEDVRQALWSAKVIAYSQGFDEIRTGGVQYGWQINVADCAKIWRDGCIIRAQLLEDIRREYAADPDLVSLMTAPAIAQRLGDYTDALRRTVSAAACSGVPAPLLASSLAYYDMARAPRANAGLTQGLRDYFGSHTYERVDAPGSFHLDWSGDRRQAKVSD